jgi:hypothetical protein
LLSIPDAGLVGWAAQGAGSRGRAQGPVAGASASASSPAPLPRPRGVNVFQMFQTTSRRPDPKLSGLFFNLVNPGHAAGGTVTARSAPRAPSQPHRQDCACVSPGRAGERHRVCQTRQHVNNKAGSRRPKQVCKDEKATTRNTRNLICWIFNTESDSCLYPLMPGTLLCSLGLLAARRPGLGTRNRASIVSYRRPSPPHDPLGWEKVVFFLFHDRRFRMRWRSILALCPPPLGPGWDANARWKRHIYLANISKSSISSWYCVHLQHQLHQACSSPRRLSFTSPFPILFSIDTAIISPWIEYHSLLASHWIQL